MPQDTGGLSTADAKLDELDREEFRDATRRLWPAGYDDATFDRDWAEFQEMKRRRSMQ